MNRYPQIILTVIVTTLCSSFYVSTEHLKNNIISNIKVKVIEETRNSVVFPKHYRTEKIDVKYVSKDQFNQDKYDISIWYWAMGTSGNLLLNNDKGIVIVKKGQITYLVLEWGDHYKLVKKAMN